jgi:hypothetical protein
MHPVTQKILFLSATLATLYHKTRTNNKIDTLLDIGLGHVGIFNGAYAEV